MMVQLRMRKREGGRRWEQYGGNEWIWEIRGTRCLIVLKRAHIGVPTFRIGSGTYRIGNGQLTWTRNSLMSRFLIMISHISSHLSLSRPQIYHHLRTWSESSMSISPCHDHELIPSTAYTKYCIIPWSTFSRSQPVFHHWAVLVVLNLLHSHDLEFDQWTESPLPSATFSRFTTFRLTTSKLSSILNSSWPSSASPNLLDHDPQVNLQTCLITASKFALSMASKLNQLRPPSASPNSLNLALQVHLQTCLITASKFA